VAGLIAALFGGKPQPIPSDSKPGGGGYTPGPGPTGAQGFPGSTSLTRTMPGLNPRKAKVRADSNTGFEQALSTVNQVRQQSAKRGQVKSNANPRLTPRVATPQPLLTAIMQATPATNLGGPVDTTTRGARTAGGHPLSEAASEGGHSERETTTPWIHAQPIIAKNVPGSNNVRNQIAQHYKAVPGQLHTYKSKYRGDLPPVNPSGQASDGNVHPERGTTDVTVPSRFVMWDGGSQTWSVQREMPYGGRGDGARGAQLNGQRYFGQGQTDQFWNAGQGDYGIARRLGGKRPVAFTQPAPWTGQFYDTTPAVENATTNQAPDLVYVSPQARRRNTATRGV
jgi:hypothetical protein